MVTATRSPVFTRVTAQVCMGIGKQRAVRISWLISRSYDAVGPWTFIVQRQKHDQIWAPVAKTIDQPWAYDHNSIVTHSPVYYRVVLQPAGGEQEISEPIELTTAYWNAHDWRIAREIVKKEKLLLKRMGIPGFLFKRKLFGDPCRCVDPVTNAVTNSKCEICYGTGIVGGYYGPYVAYILPLGSVTQQSVNERTGFGRDTIIAARVLADYFFTPDDIWMHAFTHQVYSIGIEVKTVASLRGIDLVQQVQLSLLSPFDVVAALPLPEFDEQQYWLSMMGKAQRSH